MTFDEYLALPRANISTLLELAKSPLHYRTALDVARKETPALFLGRAIHCAVLEPDAFPQRFVCWQGERRQGKAWEAFRDEHAHLEGILRADEWATCLQIQIAVHTHPAAGPLLRAQRDVERSILWEASGVECKSRLDLVGDAIVDLKSARDAGPWGFAAACARLDYHTKAAFYQDAVRFATGERLPYYLIAVEKELPYAVAVYRVPDDALDVGRARYRRLLDQLKRCRETNQWPGLCGDEVTDLVLPAWVFAGEDPVEIDLDGEVVAL